MNTTYQATHSYGKRGVLRAGDLFRVASGGPFWQVGDGRRIKMSIRGVFRFRRVAIQGRRRAWIEAASTAGGPHESIYIGRPADSAVDSRLKLRAHKVRKCIKTAK